MVGTGYVMGTMVFVSGSPTVRATMTASVVQSAPDRTVTWTDMAPSLAKVAAEIAAARTGRNMEFLDGPTKKPRGFLQGAWGVMDVAVYAMGDVGTQLDGTPGGSIILVIPDSYLQLSSGYRLYLPQEVLLGSTGLASRPISAIRWASRERL